MNVSDERMTAPIPACCRTCQNRERWIVLGVERNRCVDRRPMHEGCAWHAEATPSTLQRGVER